MEVPSHTNESEVPNDQRWTSEMTTVAVHRTCPGRAVFAEIGNSDGWIATDVSVEPER